MYQVLNVSNITDPFDEVLGEIGISEKMRGYNENTLITGQFRTAILQKKIKTLSPREIASIWCPKGRDLYIKKGKNSPRGNGRSGSNSFERTAGILGDKFFQGILAAKTSHLKKYTTIKQEGKEYMKNFQNANKDKLEWIKKDSSLNYEILMSQFKLGVRLEFSIFNLVSSIIKDLSVGMDEIELKPKINPNNMTGLSKNLEPDFMIRRLGLIGDIKSGESIQEKHLLTCAGYALAFENETNIDINWGMIYFFKAKNAQRFGKYISLPQIYIFPIDDSLREFFIEQRNQSLDLINMEKIPHFPSEDEVKKKYCMVCEFKNSCKREGLVIPQ